MNQCHRLAGNSLCCEQTANEMVFRFWVFEGDQCNGRCCVLFRTIVVVV